MRSDELLLTHDTSGSRFEFCFKPGVGMQEVMEDPVVAADGQTYDRLCIQQWFNRGKRTSPYSGAQLLDTRLTPNYSIKSAISDWQQKQC